MERSCAFLGSTWTRMDEDGENGEWPHTCIPTRYNSYEDFV